MRLKPDNFGLPHRIEVAIEYRFILARRKHLREVSLHRLEAGRWAAIALCFRIAQWRENHRTLLASPKTWDPSAHS